MKIIKTKIPENSLAEKSFKHFDYYDAYSCVFATEEEISVNDVVQAFFNSSSKVGAMLMRLRNFIVKPFGLKTSNIKNEQVQHNDFSVQPGKVIGLFKIFVVTSNEVLAGEDDRHLNFRISFYLEEKSIYLYKFTLSTTVLMNNLWGKIYFFPVKFFHKWIVRSMMKKMISQLGTSEK